MNASLKKLQEVPIITMNQGSNSETTQQFDHVMPWSPQSLQNSRLKLNAICGVAECFMFAKMFSGRRDTKNTKS